jgi:hypothetical protein
MALNGISAIVKKLLPERARESVSNARSGENIKPLFHAAFAVRPIQLSLIFTTLTQKVRQR